MSIEEHERTKFIGCVINANSTERCKWKLKDEESR